MLTSFCISYDLMCIRPCGSLMLFASNTKLVATSNRSSCPRTESQLEMTLEMPPLSACANTACPASATPNCPMKPMSTVWPCTAVPDALADLTGAEQRFLCLNQPRAKVVCIMANSGRRVLLGHSFTVVSDLQQAVDTVLPRTQQQVHDSLFVAYRGTTDGPETIATLKKYRVRRSDIRRALLWLIAHKTSGWMKTA